MNYAGTRTIETQISLDNVKAQIETFLRTIKMIEDDEDLVDMQFKNSLTNGTKLMNVLPLTLKIEKEPREVKVILHNAK